MQPKPVFSKANPIASALVVVVGAIMISIILVLGFVAFLVMAALFAVAGAVLGIRLWWAKHRLERAPENRPNKRNRSVDIIEGDFQIVNKDEDRP